MASALKELHEKDFNKLLHDKFSGVIEFGAAWCNACKLTEPIVAEVSTKFSKLQFAKVDVAKNAGLASRLGVMSLPNIFIIKNGKITDQVIGVTSAKVLEAKIKKINK